MLLQMELPSTVILIVSFDEMIASLWFASRGVSRWRVDSGVSLRSRAVATSWDNLSMVLEWVYCDITIVIKRKDRRGKGSLLVNDNQRSTENENKNKQANKKKHTRIRQGFDLTFWGELSYTLCTILGHLLVLKVLSQLRASEDQPLLGVSESSVWGPLLE